MNQFCIAFLCAVAFYVLAVKGYRDTHHHVFADLPPVKDLPKTERTSGERLATKRERDALLYAFSVR